jgi:hypothetical protein
VAAPTEDPAYRLRANGCGPEGLQITEPFGLHRCCNGHDVCYGMCGVHFEYCERKFDECMLSVRASLLPRHTSTRPSNEKVANRNGRAHSPL